MITYQKEDVDSVLDEWNELMHMAWWEVDHRKDSYKPEANFAAYSQLSQLDMYQLHTARDDGKMVGFIGMFVMDCLHMIGCKQATTDVMYVTEEHRGIGHKLIKMAEDNAIASGATRIGFTTKAALDTGALAEKLGYVLEEQTYYKDVG
jgi:GNAT superfamily N-acetyltransferase